MLYPKLKLITFFLFLIITNVSGETIKIAFWNVENLFDLIDDPHTNDNEFAINGRKNVTQEIYDLKLKNMAEVIDALDTDILGLCEIENRFVLKELDSAVARDYKIIHYDSPDNRGIDVALLYDPKKLTVTYSEPVTVTLPTGRPTRDILYVKATFAQTDLHLFVNHWPSKYGGAEKSIPLRAAAGKTLRIEVESILSQDSNAEIVIMGDLNDEPIDPSISVHLGASMDLDQVGKGESILWNVMKPWHRNNEGSTYKYSGKDMVYDHLILSTGLVDNIGLKLVKNSVGVFDGYGYRQHGGKYDGYPFRFWAGNRLLGGYSDHMPIYLKIESK
jgi:predicted extracellular nuclease